MRTSCILYYKEYSCQKSKKIGIKVLKRIEMLQGLLKKENIKKLISAVKKTGRFFGPVKGSEGMSLSELGPDDEPALDYSNLKLPPKRQLFPWSEVICTYGAENIAEAPVSGEKVVIFGVRPCDALSLTYLDKIFLDEKFIDPYYRSRKDNSVIISLACSEPLETCFCTSVGGSPAGREGADILAFVMKDSLLFEACSEKGRTFMDHHSAVFQKPGQADIKTRDEQASAAEKKVQMIGVSDITEKLKGNFDSPVWDKIAERCISCGVCAYLCPTCHCFGFYDEKAGLKGRRIRVQDSCMFSSFTIEASGHNPRTTGGERMRQRIMHKFRYTVENSGDIFCVGCGRCIGNCPVNIDIRESVAEVVK